MAIRGCNLRVVSGVFLGTFLIEGIIYLTQSHVTVIKDSFLDPNLDTMGKEGNWMEMNLDDREIVGGTVPGLASFQELPKIQENLTQYLASLNNDCPVQQLCFPGFSKHVNILDEISDSIHGVSVWCIIHDCNAP